MAAKTKARRKQPSRKTGWMRIDVAGNPIRRLIPIYATRPVRGRWPGTFVIDYSRIIRFIDAHDAGL